MQAPRVCVPPRGRAEKPVLPWGCRPKRQSRAARWRRSSRHAAEPSELLLPGADALGMALPCECGLLGRTSRAPTRHGRGSPYCEGVCSAAGTADGARAAPGPGCRATGALRGPTAGTVLVRCARRGPSDGRPESRPEADAGLPGRLGGSRAAGPAPPTAVFSPQRMHGCSARASTAVRGKAATPAQLRSPVSAWCTRRSRSACR